MFSNPGNIWKVLLIFSHILEISNTFFASGRDGGGGRRSHYGWVRGAEPPGGRANISLKLRWASKSDNRPAPWEPLAQRLILNM